VRYRINRIGDAIDPALHNMTMSHSKIKRKKNLLLPQAVSSYAAFATISYTNQCFCSAAKFWGKFRWLWNRFRQEVRALQALGCCLVPPTNVTTSLGHTTNRGMTTLPCLKGALQKNLSFVVRQDASAAGVRSSFEHFLGHRGGPPCLFMRLGCMDGSGGPFPHPGPPCPVRSAQASA
jgi:hypothetical protein